MNTPLAERMRPKDFDEYIGQTHLVGPESPLRRALEAGRLPSLILWGPPGVGKTTLARLVAQKAGKAFFQLSAVHAGVKEVREAIDSAERQTLFASGGAVLFIDEIHRFSKNQQDALLGAVEKGVVTLIGATTENPSFEIIPALLSRCQVYVLQHHSREDLSALLQRALTHDALLQTAQISVEEEEALMRYSGGDARRLLNVLELLYNLREPGAPLRINNDMVAKTIQQNMALYDKTGEQHYDVISAFIKSVRGSDPDASVYWLARMLDAGEDILFIARRMVILASEDVGLANPNALLLANATFEACRQIGMPEARIPLAQCAIYLARSAKSNSAYLAINAAMALVQRTGHLPTPLHLRNAPTRLMKDLHYGADYLYPHDYPNAWVEQQYLPDELVGVKLYEKKEK